MPTPSTISGSRSQAEAAKWYRKAADQGDDMAQFNIGTMYANGQGVRRDLVQAYMWFSLSAATQRDQRAIKARDVILEHRAIEDAISTVIGSLAQSRHPG
jgi:TPR repeat protein